MQTYPDFSDEARSEIKNSDLQDFIDNFKNVSDAEKHLFNEMIEQEFQNLFCSVRRLKPKNYNFDGVKKQFEKNENIFSWLALLPFIFWVNSPSEGMFLLSLLLAFVSLVGIFFFVIYFIYPKRSMFYRMGIDRNDFSLKNRYKLLYLLKMLMNNKYSSGVDHKRTLEYVLESFSKKQSVRGVFEELFMDALNKKSEIEARLFRENQEKKLKTSLDKEAGELNSLDTESIHIEARLEVLNYFSSSLREKQKKLQTAS